MERPIKVMYFVAEYNRFSGSQKSLLTLLKHLPKEKVDPVVVFPGEGKCVEMYRDAGLKVIVIDVPDVLKEFGKGLIYKFPLMKLLIFLRSVLPYNKKLLNFIRKSKVDIVHFNTPRALLTGFLAPKLLGKPIVLHMRGQLEVIGRLLVFLSYLIPDRLILVSENLRELVPTVFKTKCITVPNPYDPEDASRSEMGEQIPLDVTGKTVVLSGSSLVPFKGYHHLLRAIKIVNDSLENHQNIVFFGIGEVPDKKYAHYIDELKERLQIDNFMHLGWQKNPFCFYRISDILILSSVEKETLRMGGETVKVLGGEGLPRVILESMYLGKAVIATNIAGVSDLVENGVNGLLVPPADPGALARALLSLISQPDRRRIMGERGREAVERFAPG